MRKRTQKNNLKQRKRVSKIERLAEKRGMKREVHECPSMKARNRKNNCVFRNMKNIQKVVQNKFERTNLT